MVTTTSVLSSAWEAGIGSWCSGMISSPRGNSAAASSSATSSLLPFSRASSSSTHRGLVSTSARPASTTRCRVLRIALRSFTSVPLFRSSATGSHIRSTSNISCCRSAIARRLARSNSNSSSWPSALTWPAATGSGISWYGDSVPGVLAVRSSTRENGLSSGIRHSWASGPDGSRMIVGSPRRTAL